MVAKSSHWLLVKRSAFPLHQRRSVLLEFQRQPLIVLSQQILATTSASSSEDRQFDWRWERQNINHRADTEEEAKHESGWGPRRNSITRPPGSVYSINNRLLCVAVAAFMLHLDPPQPHTETIWWWDGDASRSKRHHRSITKHRSQNAQDETRPDCKLARDRDEI